MQLDSLVREIMNAAGRVHDTLGPGFLESIYARALGSELRSRGLAIEREKQVRIWYGSQIVGKHSLDLIVEGMAIVELKANHGSLAIHGAQLRSYLRATDCAVGILVNFGMPTLAIGGAPSTGNRGKQRINVGSSATFGSVERGWLMFSMVSPVEEFVLPLSS